MSGMLRQTAALVVVSTLAAILLACATNAGAAPSTASPDSASRADALRLFTAKKAGTRSVSLHWETTVELNLLGFNVYRRQNGETRRRLIERVLPAQNAPEGASYAYGDQLTKKGPARYWLQAVKGDGSRRWLGSTSVS